MTTINISLPTTLAHQLDSLRDFKGYATRSELVRELLRDRLAQEHDFKTFDNPPLEAVEKDLRKTGKYNDEFIKSVLNGLKKSSFYANKH